MRTGKLTRRKYKPATAPWNRCQRTRPATCAAQAALCIFLIALITLSLLEQLKKYREQRAGGWARKWRQRVDSPKDSISLIFFYGSKANEPAEGAAGMTARTK